MTADESPAFSRADVRAIAARDVDAIKAAIAGGGNGHQMALDLQDEIVARARTLGADAGQRYVDMYSEEIRAIEATHAAADQTSAASSVRGAVVLYSFVGAISVVVLYLILRTFA